VVVIATYFRGEQTKQNIFFEAVLFGKAGILLKIKRKNGILTVVLEDHPRIKPFSIDFIINPPVTQVFGGVHFGKDCSIL